MHMTGKEIMINKIIPSTNLSLSIDKKMFTMRLMILKRFYFYHKQEAIDSSLLGLPSN